MEPLGMEAYNDGDGSGVRAVAFAFQLESGTCHKT